MTPTQTQLINQAFSKSNAGQIHFGQVIGMLMEADVESYAVDFRSGTTTYYTKADQCYALNFAPSGTAVAQQFSKDAVKQAIVSAQQGKVLYPEFKELVLAAGCIGYSVWIAGRHVVYFGRRGEQHIEFFPD
jgi:uncharacterized protein YbcV (DUF1398 family)